MKRVVPFTAWKSVTPLAIPQQMLDRVRSVMKDRRDIHVVACVIEKGVNGNYTYTCTNSPMPAEVGLMAAHEIKRSMLRGTEFDPSHGEDPDHGRSA